MFSSWPYLLLIVPAAVLAYEDFRIRQVQILWLAIMTIISIGCAWYTMGWHVSLHNAVCNMIIATLIIVGILGWGHFRYRSSFENFFDNWFGAGDCVMMYTVVAVLYPILYVRYLLCSCLLALYWYYFINRGPTTIPLVGFMSLVLIAYSLCKMLNL